MSDVTDKHGRAFPEHLVAAGYHTQQWGPIVTKKSKLIGTYDGFGQDGAPVVIAVRYLENGVTGPELELEWDDGFRVTVIDEATAAEYLMRDKAKPRGRG